MYSAGLLDRICDQQVAKENVAAAKSMDFFLDVGGGFILLEHLRGPGDPSLLVKCGPEPAKHLNASLAVGCQRLLVARLEPGWLCLDMPA